MMPRQAPLSKTTSMRVKLWVVEFVARIFFYFFSNCFYFLCELSFSPLMNAFLLSLPLLALAGVYALDCVAWMRLMTQAGAGMERSCERIWWKRHGRLCWR
jgi:hypothetical protein